MVLAEKPVIDDSSSAMEPALLDVLLKNLSSLSSVYHKPPEVRLMTVLDHGSRRLGQASGCTELETNQDAY